MQFAGPQSAGGLSRRLITKISTRPELLMRAQKAPPFPTHDGGGNIRSKHSQRC